MPLFSSLFLLVFWNHQRHSAFCLDFLRASQMPRSSAGASPRNKLSEQGSRLRRLVVPIMLHLSLALLGATASLRRGALVPEEADGPVERGTPGAKCWGQCGGPGSCPQFCGRPEQWSGSCCELKALGSDQPDECVNRGCIGFACCVQDCDVA